MRRWQIALILVLTMFAILLFAANQRPFMRALRQLQVGMDRDEAIQALDEYSWYHEQCWTADQTKVHDLFFYGSHRYLKANIVVIMSEKRDNAYRVVTIDRDETSYSWQALYSNCIDRSRFSGD